MSGVLRWLGEEIFAGLARLSVRYGTLAAGVAQHVLSREKRRVRSIESFARVLLALLSSLRNPVSSTPGTVTGPCVHPSKRHSRISASIFGIAYAFTIAGSRAIA
jgi:hypothetical protein